MLKKSKSQHAIARELKISLGTVGYHVKRLRAAGILRALSGERRSPDQLLFVRSRIATF